MKIVYTVADNVVVGCVNLESDKGVITGPFGEVIGFYQYENNLTSNKDGTLFLTGNKSIQLILKHIEKLQREGVTINFTEFNNMKDIK